MSIPEIDVARGAFQMPGLLRFLQALEHNMLDVDAPDHMLYRIYP